MDFGLNEEQQMLKETARRFLEKECPKTLVRELQETPEAYTPALWRHIAELGWLGLPFPEKYGGIEASFLDLAVILEETGRALLPGPFFSTLLLGAYPVYDGGTEAQRVAILPAVANGEMILTMAFLETGGAFDPYDVSMAAKSAGNDYILTGTKLFVPNAHIADKILTVARTSPGEGAAGLSIFLVDARAAGISTTLLKTIDNGKLCEVVYDGVRVPRENVLGELDGAGGTIRRTMARAAVAECLQLVGSAQLVLEFALDHVKNRVQFGQVVGSFQAVQHHCANIVTDLDGARFLTYQTAWMLSEGMPCEKEVALTKAWVSDASNRILSRGHQVHGGTGFIVEHDITLHFKRTAAGEVAFGGSNYHYRAAARALGL